MKVISIINLKGGVGKTSTSINMAYELSKRGKNGKKVLVLDNDKQGNASKAFSRYNPSETSKAAKLLSGAWNPSQHSSEIITATDYENIHIIPANMSLLTATYNLTFHETGEQHTRYKTFLDSISKQYDYCIIDNPPDIALNVINALTATDQVIVPLKIDEWALAGLDIISEQINEAKQINPGIKLLGVLVTMYRNNDANIAGVEWLKKRSPVKVIGKIRYSVKADDSTFYNKPIYEYSCRCAAAQDYKKFVNDYLEKWR